MTVGGGGSVDYIGMIEGEDWLMRPVLRGLIKGESLIDGSVDLEFVSMLNEAIDVEDENRARFERANKRG